MSYETSEVIPGHWPYRVDREGHLYGIEGQELKGHVCPGGLIQVKLNDGTRHYIHQLVWLTFSVQALQNTEVLVHKDGNNLNNAIDNLQIKSKSEVAYWGYINNM